MHTRVSFDIREINAANIQDYEDLIAKFEEVTNQRIQLLHDTKHSIQCFSICFKNFGKHTVTFTVKGEDCVLYDWLYKMLLYDFYNSAHGDPNITIDEDYYYSELIRTYSKMCKEILDSSNKYKDRIARIKRRRAAE